MSVCLPKIKVCHLASGDLWAGAEIQVVNMCRGLLDTEMVDVSAVVLNKGRLAQELQYLGIDVTVMDEQKNSGWGILWQLTRNLRRKLVDVLHTHRYKENILGSMAAKICGVPCVLRTVHGAIELYWGWPWAKMRTYRALDDLASRYCVDALIGVSRDITGELERRFTGTTITYLPNCIDARRLLVSKGREEKRVELGMKPLDFVIGTVGRLAPVKGTEYLIRAFSEMAKRCEDVHLLVVGDGPLASNLEALASSLGLEKMVRFLGWRDDCIDILNSLDLLVIPSLHEGTPTVLLEAMFLSVPVVGSATGGIAEIVTDGRNGLLARPGCESDLAAKCLRIISDTSLARQLAINANRDVRKYLIEEMTPSLVTLYMQLIKSGRST